MDSGAPVVQEIDLSMCMHNVFTREECNQIIDMAHKQGFERGWVGFGEPSYNDVRTNTVAYLQPSPDTLFIYQRLRERVHDINDGHYQLAVFDIENITVCRYDSNHKQQYEWHVDSMIIADRSQLQRKLSTTTLLCDPSQYDGGELQMMIDNVGANDIDHNPKQIGDTTVFPSFLMHRVTPVTRGVRYSLVTWFLGPRWI